MESRFHGGITPHHGRDNHCEHEEESFVAQVDFGRGECAKALAVNQEKEIRFVLTRG